MSFCKRCYSKYVHDFRLKNPDPRVQLDVDKLVFRCQVPVFDHNGHGEVVVRIWNCKTDRYDDYTQAAYLQKKAEGLLP
jgi:hypothetical protein